MAEIVRSRVVDSAGDMVVDCGDCDEVAFAENCNQWRSVIFGDRTVMFRGSEDIGDLLRRCARHYIVFHVRSVKVQNASGHGIGGR